MTTQQLIQMTLRKLDRPTDNDTVTLYKERLLGYLNEALLDLTADFRPWRRDTLTVANGQAELSSLPRACLKVLAARVEGQRRLFYYGSTRGTLLFPGMGEGTVELTYRFLPARLGEPKPIVVRHTTRTGPASESFFARRSALSIDAGSWPSQSRTRQP